MHSRVKELPTYVHGDFPSPSTRRFASDGHVMLVHNYFEYIYTLRLNVIHVEYAFSKSHEPRTRLITLIFPCQMAAAAAGSVEEKKGEEEACGR
jgi:hypothetical protein